MGILAHHFVEVEVLGRQMPVGPAEHAVAFLATGLALVLMAYGAYAGVRDLRRWRQRRAQPRAAGGEPAAEVRV